MTLWSWEEALSKLSLFKHFYYFTASRARCPERCEPSAALRHTHTALGVPSPRYTQHFSAAPTSAALLKVFTHKQTRLANRLPLTGLVATNSWLLATAVSEIIVTMELQTKEKNRFLCRVILWQLKLLEERNKNK